MSFLRTAELAADQRVRRGMEAQLAERERRLADGEASLGWKLGFGSAEAMDRLEIAAPLVGFLTDRSPLPPGDAARVDDWTRPALEPEIAVRLGADLPPGGDLAAAAGAVVAIAPVFELADVDPPPTDVVAILAGNIFHRQVVLAPEARIDPAGFAALRASVVRNGDESTVADPQAATGELVGLIRHVADLLGAFGASLRAGEIVICGSIVPPIGVSPGDAVAYRLDPVGAISVRVA
jgi:2-keto-4-pentenoate hydratase